MLVSLRRISSYVSLGISRYVSSSLFVVTRIFIVVVSAIGIPGYATVYLKVVAQMGMLLCVVCSSSTTKVSEMRTESPIAVRICVMNARNCREDRTTIPTSYLCSAVGAYR